MHMHIVASCRQLTAIMLLKKLSKNFLKPIEHHDP
jgi:hypothetical protein